MNQETYDALKTIIKSYRHNWKLATKAKVPDIRLAFDELQQIKGWIDEVAKDYEECPKDGKVCAKCATFPII